DRGPRGSIPALTGKLGPWSQAAFRRRPGSWDRGPRQHSGADREVGTVVPGSIPALTGKLGPWSQAAFRG
ncbi:TPA: hypothetical protein ACTYM8_005765, partial [Klebsiella michiganensis]